MFLTIVLLGLGCKPKGETLDTAGDGGSTTGDGGTGQTTTWIDTGTETTEDGGTDTGTTVTEPAPVGVQVWPSTMLTDPETSWAMRLVATWDDGTVGDGTVGDGTGGDSAAIWTSADPSVVSVDSSGLATAIMAGSTSIRGCVGEVCAEVPVEVREDRVQTVRVVARESGLGLEGVRVMLGQGAEKLTDADGWASLALTEAGTQTISAWTRERVPLTAVGVAHREIVLSLQDQNELSVATNSISGPVDLDGVPRGGAGDLKMGVAAPSFSAGPLLLLPSQLVATDRTLTLYGLEAEVPSNVYIRDVAEDWSVPAQTGTTAIWTLAAPLPISEVTSSLAGVTDVIGLMLEDLDRLVWGWHDGVTLAEGESGTASLAPATELSGRLRVHVGSLPLGFRGDEEMLVMLGELLEPAGFLPVGVGVGRGEVEISYAEVSIGASTGQAVAVAAQVGGIGSGKGNGLCASWSPASGPDQVLPPLQQAPAVHLFSPSTREFAVETDARARFVLIGIAGGEEGKYRELLTQGGRVEGTLPNLGDNFGYGATTWSLIALEMAEGTLHDQLRLGWTEVGALARESWTSASLEIDL